MCDNLRNKNWKEETKEINANSPFIYETKTVELVEEFSISQEDLTKIPDSCDTFLDINKLIVKEHKIISQDNKMFQPSFDAKDDEVEGL